MISNGEIGEENFDILWCWIGVWNSSSFGVPLNKGVIGG